MKFTVVDVFAGVGGFSLGFQKAGFQVVGAIELDPKHCHIHKINFPQSEILIKDVRELSKKELFLLDKCPDVLIGGPPCQGFSVAGKQRINDKRNNLIFEFARAVEIFKPRVFVMENVDGLGQKKHENLRKKFTRYLSKLGYHLIVKKFALMSNDYGVPQKRKRLFWIGTIHQDQFRWPPDKKNPITVADAISDLCQNPEIDIDINNNYRKLLSIHNWKLWNCTYRPEVSCLNNHEYPSHTPKVEARFSQTKPGEREPISRFARLKWSGLAPTLRAGTPKKNGSFMAARPIHPSENRCITVREAARLHSFPDWFQFDKTRWYGHMQIGNSVPPLLSYSIAVSVSNHLKENGTSSLKKG